MNVDEEETNLSSEEIELRSCIDRRERMFRRLQLTYDLIARLPVDQDVFLSRAEKIDEHLDLFEQLQNHMSRLNIIVPNRSKVSVGSVSVSYEDLHHRVSAKAREILRSQSNCTLDDRVSHEAWTVRPKLPPIHIPSFSGKVEEFLTFKGLFDTVIHNTNLPSIQKFSFLLSYLEQPALSTIDHLELTSENYALAYKLLVDRYTDKRLVGSHLFTKLSQFKPTSGDPSQRIQQFLDQFCAHYKSLEALSIPKLADFIILHMALKVVDPDIKRLFENKYTDTDFPTFDNLVSFMREQHKVVKLVDPPNSKSYNTSHSNRKFSTSHGSHKGHKTYTASTKSFISKSHSTDAQSEPVNSSKKTLNSTHSCSVCKQDHRIYLCPKFQSMSTDKRFEVAKNLNLCYACLGHHSRSQCSSKLSCRSCHSKNHHSMLHRDRAETVSSNSVSNSVATPHNSHTNSTHPCTSSLNCQTNGVAEGLGFCQSLIGTAKAHILSPTGDWIECRLIIDPASESSFITESLVQTLKLNRSKLSVNIVGVGSSSFANNRGSVTCSLKPLHTNTPVLSVDAIILSSISPDTPRCSLSTNIRSRFSQLSLADPEFDRSRPVDLLLGVQHYSEVLNNELVHIPGEPAAIKTIFGFVLFGKVPTNVISNVCHSYLTHAQSLDETIRRFWELEEVCYSDSSVIDTHDECERFFTETTTRDDFGRYEVALPFKNRAIPRDLGSTRNIAHKRVLGLERRLTRKPELYASYQENLQDYLDQDHIRPALHPVDYLLTHHIVVRDSVTTQVRVVFNGSEKSSTSHSLNDYLLSGPKLQADISVILLNFRLHAVALTADIKQMFRCIRLQAEVRQYTHFLWRQNHSLPISEWELTTLPFGLTCSPYIAQRVIKQLMTDEGQRFPYATEIIQSGIYVDDIVCSVPTSDDSIRLYHQLIGLFKLGGFVLRKFASNNPELLSCIPSDQQISQVSFNVSPGIKLLGFMWDPVSDTFGYGFCQEPLICTKRAILSQVARIFDVNGYLTPLTFWIKAFIQLLWIEKLEWDAEIPCHLRQIWVKFHSQLPHIKNIRIPRYIHSDTAIHFTLIGFCDASEKGYAACFYLRIQLENHEISTYLLKAKSKVAPLKPLTIPRLELNGAVLLAKLYHSINDFRIRLPNHQLYCFTDSMVVLCWLNTSPHSLNQYVANRVAQIVDILPSHLWWHVSSQDNAADVASRGLYPSQLCESDIWWKGPSYLTLPIEQWVLIRPPLKDPLPEVKSSSVGLTSSLDSESGHFLDVLFPRISSLSRLERIVAYVLRFVKNLCLQRVTRRFGILTAYERARALSTIVSWTQHQYFSDVLNALKHDRPIKGFIRHLTPFISQDGLLRVGGRLSLSPLSNEAKHPLIIPRKSPLALLICQFYHKLTLHGGPQLLQSLIQRKFWIIGMRSLLRHVIFNCIDCYRFKARPLEPFMSSVPGFRFQCSRAFVETGVDLAGPYSIKESRRRNARWQKGWIVLFTCLTTRAVYLDLVSDLSTATFLASFDRFIARRGVPARMHSDLGTNFVGSARCLRELQESLTLFTDDIKAYCESKEILWQFNPPASPNFGGCWEAAIKLMKHHLRRIIADRPLTHEEFNTVLAKVEAVLNSRPLCPSSSNPTDGFDYLTPGHFLVGAPLLLSRPDIDSAIERSDLTHRWKLLYQSIQDIWKRWLAEYVHTLMQRSKWDKETEPIKVGQLVLLSDKSTLPASWPIGRVLEVFPGSDGVIRVVRLKTPRGYLTRPLNKLCKLPFST